MYVSDGDYIKDIEVNDLRNRYLLTRSSTQKQVGLDRSQTWQPSSSIKDDSRPWELASIISVVVVFFLVSWNSIANSVAIIDQGGNRSWYVKHHVCLKCIYNIYEVLTNGLPRYHDTWKLSS